MVLATAAFLRWDFVSADAFRWGPRSLRAGTFASVAMAALLSGVPADPRSGVAAVTFRLSGALVNYFLLRRATRRRAAESPPRRRGTERRTVWPVSGQGRAAASDGTAAATAGGSS